VSFTSTGGGGGAEAVARSNALRSFANGDMSRIRFDAYGEEMILLHGFIKKTQKTSKPDLELARSRKKEMES
jgi:phage-related protein